MTKYLSERMASAINSRLERRAITMREAAKESGVAASTICRCARGKDPDVHSLGMLAHWLGFTVDFFYGETQ